MKASGLYILILLFLIFPEAAFCQKQAWEITIAGGIAKNIKTPLNISQQNQAEINFKAKYKTEPFNPPIYYDIRVAAWQSTSAWELKFTHHKIILQNKPAEVQRFSITDGFNLLTVNRLWLFKGFTYSIGGGVVVTHPESTIRNQVFPENGGFLNKGYYLSGPSAEAALARRFYLANHWLFLVEGRATASYVRVPVQHGHASVTNAALHLLAGIGYKFGP